MIRIVVSPGVALNNGSVLFNNRRHDRQRYAQNQENEEAHGLQYKLADRRTTSSAPFKKISIQRLLSNIA